jgi:hypothetical protein
MWGRTLWLAASFPRLLISLPLSVLFVAILPIVAGLPILDPVDAAPR